MLRYLRTLTPGFLAFLGLYEILSGLRVPFSFTIDRVTGTYLFQAPLFGRMELDVMVYALAVSSLAYVEDRPRVRVVYLSLLIASASTLTLSLLIGLASPAYLGLGLASVSSALVYARGKGFDVLLPGVLFSLASMEVVGLTAVSTYYIIGRWVPFLLHIVFRERLIWSPLEWMAVPMLILAIWNSLSRTLLGKPFIRVPKLRRIEARTRSSGLKAQVFLALVLTVLLVSLPHLPPVNPDFKPVSVDTLKYGSFFQKFDTLGMAEAFSTGASGRPVYLLALYHIWALSGRNTVLLMDLVYQWLTLLFLTLASFYAGLRFNGSRAAVYAALLVPLGYAVPAFIAGGFQANGLALPIAILALTIDPRDRLELAKLTALMTLVALVHPWTHLMYSAALVAYSLRKRGRLMPTLIAVTSSYILSYVIDYYLASIHIPVVAVQPLSRFGLYLVENWFDAVQLWSWNTLSNPIYLSSSIAAFDGLATSVMCVTAPLTLIQPAGILYRLILNTPLQLQVSKFLENLEEKYAVLMLLALLVRVLENLSGLTPLGS